MTNKEAIEILRGVSSFFGRDCIPNETQQAIDMAISALEKQEGKKPELHPKPLTNADRIRAMTDEELVQFIMSPCMKWNEPCPKSSCFDCLRDWLKQEANCEST